MISEFRSFTREPSEARLAELRAQAAAETERIDGHWRRSGKPDLWFTYHPYYKAPDLIGPDLSRRFAIPYVTAEASYSARRDRSGWQDMQAPVAEAVSLAAVNICLTGRDRTGLTEAIPAARTARLAPFLDAAAFLDAAPSPDPARLVTVAMMRPGDKMDSYRMLAAALARLAHRGWVLEIVGDGPCRAEVEALFAGFDAGRILWRGELAQAEIARILSRGGSYLWPGCGEAYGLAYLEAQAAGLPVVAQAIAGVPEVVADGVTGFLTPAGDVGAYAEAVGRLLGDAPLRDRMGGAARRFVAGERSLDAASLRLAAILSEHVGLAR